MSTYYEENRELLERLQKNAAMQEIHGCQMLVKEIPDPMGNTVLDPRVYAERRAAEEKGNPLADYLEIPVGLVREMPAAASRDVTDCYISSERRVIETRNGSTNIFIYNGAAGAQKPMMLFIHGGAFIAGHTAVVENFCKLVAKLADSVVVGVDYRLSPEHRFPTALHDCYDALCWMYDHAAEFGGDRKRLMVGGDSAGGTLAIGCCMLEQERVAAEELQESRICYEALVYPGVLVDNFRMEDYRWKLSEYEIPEDDFLAMGAAVSLKAMTAEMPGLYMGVEGHVTDPLAAPLCAKDLSYLPKTLNVLCEYDYLRLQGEAFSRKLAKEGVDVRTVLYRGMDHEFVDRTGYCPQAYDAAAEIAKDVAAL